MVVEKCVRCNGAGEQTFHKGTSREHRLRCPCCKGKGERVVNREIVKKIVEEV